MKKKIIIAGLCALCVVLAVAVWLRITAETPSLPPETLELTVTPSITPSDVTVRADNGDKPAPDIQDELIISTATPQPTPEGEPPVSTGTEQTIQADVVKPTPPPPPVEVEPDNEVSHEKPDDPAMTNPVATPKPATPTPKPAQPSEPQSGDKKDGKIYIPGFGWIEDQGGGSEGKVVGSDGDINKQVGSMG